VGLSRVATFLACPQVVSLYKLHITALYKGQTIMVSKPCTGFQVKITVIMV